MYYKPEDKKASKHRRSISLEGCTVQALQDKDKPGKCLFEVRKRRRRRRRRRQLWVSEGQKHCPFMLYPAGLRLYYM